MLKRFKSKYRHLLGVDISPTSVKIVEISHQDGLPCVEGYGCRRLDSSSGDSGRESLITTLKSLLSEISSSARVAATTVPDAAVICKTIQLADSLNALEMEKLILLETKKYLPYPSDEINFDFAILGPAKNSLGMVDVYLVASRADNIRNRVDILKEIGKDLKIVGIESQVIATVVQQILANKAMHPTRKDIFALVQINSEFMHFYVFDCEKSIYRIEEAIASPYEIAIEDLVRCQEQHGRPMDSECPIVKPFLHSISLAIKRNLQLFFSSCPYDYIESIYLTGDLRALAGIEQEIQKETGFKTLVVQPRKDLNFSKKINSTKFKKEFSLYTVAYGLALRLTHDY